MTQEKNQLLLKDLSARLLYGVKVLDNSHKNYGVSKLINIGLDGSMLIDNEINDIQYYPIIDDVKPYLRPMLSMTEEEKVEYYNTMDKETQRNYPNSCDFSESVYYSNTIKTFDWLNEHHFDYRGLIEKGLALEAPKGMYN